LILFLAAFTIVVVRVLFGANKKLYTKMERMPLEDDDIIKEENES